MISASSLSKRFGRVLAVSDVSFKASVGEIIGFLGPNGAGKTTTMRLLLGYFQPTSGTVRIQGKNPIDKRVSVLSEVGYLPENNPLYPEMKVREYLEFVSGIRRVTIMDTLLEEVGIVNVMDKKIDELSRGFRQRVGLAAALLADPPVLLLDEPTSGLDPIEQEKIRHLIKRISKKKTILFSTHILSEVEDIATRLIIIDKGKLVYDGKKPRTKGGVTALFKKLVKSS